MNAQRLTGNGAVKTIRRAKYTRFVFPHGDEKSCDASQVLIEFLFTLISDDRECPHGYVAEGNYIDIPRGPWLKTLAELESEVAA